MAGRDTNLEADIIIHGAGIAGLWTLARLKALGYDALLTEPRGIGGIQTIASQGIIHSGLKYVLGGKINPLARSISAMPEIWKVALRGEGPVNLSGARVAAESQLLMIPGGMAGAVMKIGAKNFFGAEIKKSAWPREIAAAGFEGSLVDMGEPVLDIPSVVRALAEPHKNAIRAAADGVTAKIHIHTAAAGNDASGIPTQRRPLLMGMMKNAPFPVWAHFVGASEKPVATITTHAAADGSLIWYFGGQAAEHEKESDPGAVYGAIREALEKYMPAIDTGGAAFSVFPVDRVEAKGAGFMPDMPVVRKSGERIFAWPTKLTFAPLMADKIVEVLAAEGISPSHKATDWSFLPEIGYAQPPWETASWTQLKSR